jgi:hypothetical protein
MENNYHQNNHETAPNTLSPGTISPRTISPGTIEDPNTMGYTGPADAALLGTSLWSLLTRRSQH